MTQSMKHWWPRYVGDYRSKTARLSMLEHGAYCLLLDEYYATGEPLYANSMQLHRICRAVAQDERDAVDQVINTFFVLKDGKYYNERADKELLKRCNISEKRRLAAEKRHSINHANAPANAQVLHTHLHDTSTSTSTDILSSDNISPLPPLPQTDLDFESLWLAWIPYDMPKGSKIDARKAYAKALKKQGVTHETIIRSAAEYCRNKGISRCKTKHVSAWLNGEGWRDDYAVATVPTGRINGRENYGDDIRRAAIEAENILDRKNLQG